ncbi:MAG TPA: peptidase M24, partial [Spirochaetia bacterium]
MLNIDKAQRAIREESLSGWLFSNVFHRDQIADLVLGIPSEKTNTRPWICILYPDRQPLKIVHRIEAGILDNVPGETISYYTREQLTEALGRGIPRGGRIAADYSVGIPVGSYLDHGTALLLESVGAVLAPAESLVSRYLGTLDDEGVRSHEEAADVLYAAIEDAWGRIRDEMRHGRVVLEGDARDWISAVFAAADLEADGPPIVGAGKHTGDPHFSVDGAGARLTRGDVVQFDIWAIKKTP